MKTEENYIVWEAINNQKVIICHLENSRELNNITPQINCLFAIYSQTASILHICCSIDQPDYWLYSYDNLNEIETELK